MSQQYQARSSSKDPVISVPKNLARRPHSAETFRALREAVQPEVVEIRRRSSQAKAPQDRKCWTPAGLPSRPPRMGYRMEECTTPRSAVGHSVCGSFLEMARPATGGSRGASDARISQLQSMIHHRFESRSGAHVLVPTFQRIAHESRDVDPQQRRAHPRDLARYLRDCGAHATEAEAAKLLVKVRGESSDGKFGMKTFHDLARGLSQERRPVSRSSRDGLRQAGPKDRPPFARSCRENMVHTPRPRSAASSRP